MFLKILIRKLIKIWNLIILYRAPVQIEFMEEKLVENLTMLCEVINGEYVSASKAQTGRFEVMKKAGSLQYPNALYVSLFELILSMSKSNRIFIECR